MLVVSHGKSREAAHPSRLAWPSAHGRRGRQSGDPRTASPARTVAHACFHPRALRDHKTPKGDVLADGAYRGHPGGQAHVRAHPDVPPGAAHLGELSSLSWARTAWRSRRVPEAIDRTGVEMEALTAVQRGGADALRHAEGDRPRMVIESFALHEKTGGKSGDFRRARNEVAAL